MVAFAAADDGVFTEAFVRVGKQVGVVGFVGGRVGVGGFGGAAVEQHGFTADKAARFFVGLRQTGFDQRSTTFRLPDTAKAGRPSWASWA